MVGPLRHRQTKGAENRHARPTVTAPHGISTDHRRLSVSADHVDAALFLARCATYDRSRAPTGLGRSPHIHYGPRHRESFESDLCPRWQRQGKLQSPVFAILFAKRFCSPEDGPSVIIGILALHAFQ